ncbi:MAG: GxxExxY protein [Candidatus Methanoperedens sp.]|nr:GxxExxY protein [Candidatus Methanoperedens sp.]
MAADNQHIATDFLSRDLSYKIVKCLYNTRNKYGMHHNERVYHLALREEFELMGIKYKNKPRIELYSLTTGKKLTYYEPDYIIEDKIIIEIKAKRPIITQDQIMQIIEYLKISKYEIAYLVNFKEQEFKPRRFIHTLDRKLFCKLSAN